MATPETVIDRLNRRLAHTVAQLEFCQIEMKNTWQANQTLIKEREYYRKIAEGEL